MEQLLNHHPPHVTGTLCGHPGLPYVCPKIELCAFQEELQTPEKWTLRVPDHITQQEKRTIVYLEAVDPFPEPLTISMLPNVS